MTKRSALHDIRVQPVRITGLTFFQRAFCNLVENAVTHTPPGGAATPTAVTTHTSTTVIVGDTGSGVPAAHLPHVFDRFDRADPFRSSSAGNVGPGLAVVKGVVDLHGGPSRWRARRGGEAASPRPSRNG
jgi:signal transduction histidine kinase